MIAILLAGVWVVWQEWSNQKATTAVRLGNIEEQLAEVAAIEDAQDAGLTDLEDGSEVNSARLAVLADNADDVPPNVVELEVALQALQDDLNAMRSQLDALGGQVDLLGSGTRADPVFVWASMLNSALDELLGGGTDPSISGPTADQSLGNRESVTAGEAP